MSAKLKEIIQESFNDPEAMNPEKLKELIHETMRFFYRLQEQMTSKEETVRNEAREEATNLKALLEEQVAKLCAHLGKTPEEILAISQERQRFTEKEWQTLDQAQSEIKEFKQNASEIFPDPKLEVMPKAKKKKTKNWIAG